MTQTMIERMARAMCEADGNIWEYTIDEPDENDNGHDSQRDMYLAHARAALTALLEPTEAMVEAGAPFHFDHSEVRDKAEDALFYREIECIFSAMIRAAQGDFSQ